jgi:nucleotide-binding universal stress UspA family protein
MKKILCPVDFSDASLNALEFAASIGDQFSSKLTLLNIFTPSDYNAIVERDDYDGAFEELKTESERKLKSICKEVKKIDRGLEDCAYKLRAGKMIDVLNECAYEDHDDLIVIGTTGYSKRDKRYIGSNAVDIIRHSSCHVLCIPDGYTYHGIKKIVYATDYQEEDKIAIQLIISMASALDAHIEILHISHHDKAIDRAIYEEFAAEIKDFIRFDKVSFSREVFHHVSEGLDEHVQKTETDLLVLLDKKRNFFQKLFHQGLTSHLTNLSDFPFMIVKL